MNMAMVHSNPSQPQVDPHSAIAWALTGFRRHSLEEQEQAALMVRQDHKFVIRLRDVIVLLEQLVSNYSVLSISNKQLFGYQTRYFDTQNKQCFHHHHNGKARRFKLRIRRYLDCQQSFVECKLKNNKGQTQKLRRVHQGDFSLASASDFLFRTLSAKSDQFHAVLDVHYLRMTFMSASCDQRITIDLNLQFDGCQSQQSVELENTAVVEIKQKNGQMNTQVYQTLKRLGYQPKDFSKYCMGCVLTRTPGIKYNRFKPNILFLKRIENQL